MNLESIQFWRLDSECQSFVFCSQQGIPECIYWGKRLSDKENLQHLYANQRAIVTPATLDVPSTISLLPEEAKGFVGHSGISISSLSGERLLSHFVLDIVKSLKNTLIFKCVDATLNLQLTLHLQLFSNCNTLVVSSDLSLIDPKKSSIRVDWLSTPVFPVASHANSYLEFIGHWCNEFQSQTSQWQFGIHQRQSFEGRTGHGNVPLFICGEQPLKNTSGETYGWHLAWSGGHKLIAEELFDGRRQVQFGATNHTSILNSNHSSIQSPKLIISHSSYGINGIMDSFHRYAREELIQFSPISQHRRVYYNCWESIYFDHCCDDLKNIASTVAKLGAELFVLDDGWFTGRNDATQGLGDWTVDIEKYPQGLQPLIDHVHSVNMAFGLWVEPEMVNPKSQLYSEHPEWVLDPHKQLTGRHQLVLNLAIPEVLDYLYNRISDLLSQYAIEYLKWDHNRLLIGATSSQTSALYSLLKRLRKAFPHLEIESCSSGGGRIDFAMMEYTQRFWLSDSNDALERWRMQHEASVLLPPEVTGSHVGAHHCHTSGRQLPIAFRSWVAASRHLGFEMDPRELTDDECLVLKEITAWWKANRQWLFQGRLYRLDSDDKSIIAEMTISKDKQRFIVMVAQMQSSNRTNLKPLRLTGLANHKHYQLTILNREHIKTYLWIPWQSPLNTADGIQLTGLTLQQQGLQLPVSFPASLWVIEGVLKT